MTQNEKLELSRKIAGLVSENGGTCYYVGGFVRDRLMGKENKDIDLEVHGVSPDTLERILDTLGKRISIGESFGIYSLGGSDIDISMPRKETATGKGHRDFSVLVDPFIGTYKAALRRDFTINALMENVLTGEITDHFGGVKDIRNKTLRHISDKSFPEDPLRVLRAAQFASRFNFRISKDTINLCREIDITTLSKERIEGEMKKALLRAEKPSIFFRSLREMDRLSYWFPELESLIGVEQRHEFHLEGDVWSHTMMVLDEAAKRREKTKYPFGFMMSALCHDFGKSVSTKTEYGVTRSIGHEEAGLPLIKTFLRRITNETKLIKYVLSLCELHMRPNIIASQKSSVKATNKLFDLSAEPGDLIHLACADDKGRICLFPHEENEEFLFERLEIYEEYMSRPFVQGKDLIEAGLSPDESFSEILAYAHKLRLSGVNKDTALKQCLTYRKEKFNQQNN